MTVNEKLDFDGGAKNRGSLRRSIPWTHHPAKKISRFSFLDIYLSTM